MSYFNELEYILDNSQSDSKEDFISLMYEICQLNDTDKLAALNEIKLDIEEYRIEQNICPNCGADLTNKITGIYQVDYLGQLVPMTESTMVCSDNCGFELDN